MEQQKTTFTAVKNTSNRLTRLEKAVLGRRCTLVKHHPNSHELPREILGILAIDRVSQARVTDGRVKRTGEASRQRTQSHISEHSRRKPLGAFWFWMRMKPSKGSSSSGAVKDNDFHVVPSCPLPGPTGWITIGVGSSSFPTK